MTISLLNDLNKDQQEVVVQTEGPILILAGAGSGKTRVLTYKVAYLIQEKHIDPSRILMVTFTNKAAGEMKKRIQELLSFTPRSPAKPLAKWGEVGPFAGTFHSFCAKILRREGKLLGIPINFLIYDQQDQLDIVKDVMKELDISQKNFNPGAILHTISEAKNELITAAEYPQYSRGYFQEVVAQVYLSYQKKLRENTALDFDDLLSLTVQLFQKFPDILGAYQEKYRYILIDEYQDTNKAQYVLSTLLSGRYKNITVVGDASQSIYRFRGADFRNIVNFKSQYPDMKQFHLEQNYRSTQTILDAAHGVISKNTSHPILKLWTEKKEGPAITLYEARTEHDEATFITTTILQSNQPFNDFAVLYRTNAQSRVIEEAFLHAGVPYTLVGGTRFYERREIKDVLSYLRLIVHPKDTVSFKRVEKLGKGRMKKFLDWKTHMDADNKLVSFSTLEFLDTVLDVTGYLDLYDANVQEEAYRLENIKELRSVATEFPVLSEFLDTVALLEQEPIPDRLNNSKRTNVVTLMTLHASKGLEFHTIFLIGMEEGLFPHSRSLMDKEDLEEERRLCYVGVTRAKVKLYLSYANRRLFFGTRTQNMVSRFIADIPESLLEKQISLDPSRGFREDEYLL
ncbi:MAG: ATP-dependent DNA helicase PcrA [Microgenomates group bacterium GW2011_GWC1_43_11]|uniref:DNA 3'-5' helicase n=2 Tax=Candidatus Gottesmaniibacteriota TaxID=1752720 RepID=A0A0G1J3N6_9BACT|nr:MAG: ATP-dependent DNA helicase PcrA [Microgenomates group bacterium GW2011_GWC1_43_11]KKT38617.1 MAG: ATP-dependent DNA helicase PcrA [Candidatus Gottesmanbacteria bacterium GW2011_GWB1_44_11c]HCM82282.1 ATP-dependent DNA helicase PcrA [Patescibacteria group bacterium]